MATSYTKTVWTTGDFITADRMNNIENALEAVSSEISNASGQNAAEDDTLASRLNDMIMIQNSQPDSPNNEIWINSSTASPNNAIEIPTEEEFEELRDSIAEQYSESLTYEVGKYVLHNNDLYKCTTAVETVGTWTSNANKFTSVILANEVKNLKDETNTEIGELKSELSAKIIGVNTAISEFSGEEITIGISAVEWTNDKFIDINGDESTNSNFRISEKLRVKEGDSISYGLWGYNNVICVIAAYDNNDAFIKKSSVFYDSSYNSGVTVFFEGTYVVPEGVTQIIFGDWENKTDEYITGNAYKSYGKSITGIEQEITGIEQEITGIEQEITGIEQEIHEDITLGLNDLNWTNGAYIQFSTGNIIQDSRARYSDLILVNKGDNIPYSLTGVQSTVAVIAAYDGSGTYKYQKAVGYKPGETSGSVITLTGAYVVDSEIKKIRICEWNYTSTASSDNIAIPQKILKSDINTDDINALESSVTTIQQELDNLSIVNQWKDKKWVAFGTSITDNYSDNSYITQGGEHNGEHTGKYVPYLLELSELSSTNFKNRGMSGAKINGHILYYIRYYTSDMANADLITIEGAVNDFASAVPLGQVGDTIPYTNELLPDGTSEGTFAGACYQAFTTALENAPNAVIVLLTESTGKNNVGYANYWQLRKNNLNLYQKDYIDMTIKVAELVGIPVITCGQDSMINAQNPQYIADHIHHTYLGGYQYAKTIWAKLKNIPLKQLNVPE